VGAQLSLLGRETPSLDVGIEDLNSWPILDAVAGLLSRAFMMRPHRGGKSIRFNLGWGDLFIMGGTCQRLWEHTVPKTKSVTGPRISIMFRHSARLLESAPRP
jgi:hypothetical protein